MSSNTITEVYETSKSEKLVTIEGSYIETGMNRNGRNQILHNETGKKYWLPTENPSEGISLTLTENDFGETPPNQSIVRTYIVQRGENINTVAKMFNVSVTSLYALNGTMHFTVGQKVTIPKE